MRTHATLILLLVSAWLMCLALVMTSPVKADDPIGDALATLAAATARAEQVRASQRATAAALSVESTRTALDELNRQRALTATAQSQSARATQSALDELSRQRAATATMQAQSALATSQVQNAQATSQVQNAQATTTSQALTIAAQATDAALFASAQAERSDRFSFGLLVVEIFFVCGAAFVLWRLTGTLAAWAVQMRPQPEPLFGGLIEATPASGQVVDIGPEVATPAEGRMPSFVTVVDNPEIEAAIGRWAERYDLEHGGDNGD